MPSLTPNLIKTWVDIRNNPEHWNQKFSLIEFHEPDTKKPWWNKDYNFIPHWKRYKAARDWIKNTKFPEYNCKIGWNANNEILLVTQNFFGSQRLSQEKTQELLGKIRKKIHREINNTDNKDYQAELKEALRTNDWEKLADFSFADLYETELEQWIEFGKEEPTPAINYDLSRNDLALFWKKQLYFITSFTYTNNYKLTVEIRARKCQLFLSYYHWTSSAGMGTINQAPNLIKDWTDEPRKDEKGRNYLDEQYRLHYDFCGDLGIKKIEQQAFLSYQPSFQLFRAKYETYAGLLMDRRIITWSEQSAIKGGEPKQLNIPTDLSLSRFNPGAMENLASSWNSYTALIMAMSAVKFPIFGDFAMPILIRRLAQKLMDTKIFLVVGPTEMDPAKGAYFSKMEDKEEVLFPKNPTFTKWLKEQPHLWDHTTFQFYLFNKITMTANGRYLGIREKDGRFILPYKLFINYSPANLYYRWEFAYITVKCELSHQGTFEDWTNPARTLRNFSTQVKGSVKAFGFGAGGASGGGFGWADNSERAGDMKDKDDPKPEEEAQTERMFKNTFRNFLDKSVEPSQFNSNTIDFHYSLGEFFNRLTDPIFFYRVEISELLYNRLNWANNKSSQLNLPLSWRELGTWTQKPGLWKWSQVYLEKDKDNFWTNLMTRGYYLDDGKELTNPDLRFAHAANHIGIGGNAWNISLAEEEVIEIEEEHEGKDNTGGDTIIPESTSVYIYKDSYVRNEETGTDYLPQAIQALPSDAQKRIVEGDNKWYFWHDKNYTATIDIPSGSYTQKIRGLTSEGDIDTQQKGDKLTIQLIGTNLSVRVHGKFIKREVKVKPPVRTVEQEIDEAELENEVADELIEEIARENGEKMEKELGGDKEVDLEEEPEPEGEPEEKEDEQEETISEPEEEKETEQEEEEEPEKEDEEESEEEEEKEEEDEGEGEEEL